MSTIPVIYSYAGKENFFDNVVNSVTGTNQLGELTDNRSATVKTPPGGWRAPRPYSRTIVQGNTKRLDLNLRVDFRQTGTQNKFYSMFAGVQSGSGASGWTYALPAFPSGLVSRAERQALKKLKASNVNLAVAFGERAATARFVTNNVERLIRAARAVRRFDVAALHRELFCHSIPKKDRRSRKFKPDNDSASLWLEYQYGARPLMSDCYGAVKELHEKDNRFADRYTCSVKGYGDDRTDVQTIGNYAAGFGLLEGTFERRLAQRDRCMVRLDYVLQNPMLATLASLGITNPLEVAWELVPFSFVADWFIPVGSYLSSLDAATGWSFKGGSLSKITRANVRARVLTVRVNSTSAVDQKPVITHPVNYQRHVRFDRSVYGSSPVPQFPSFDGDLTAGKRLQNAIALLTSTLRR